MDQEASSRGSTKKGSLKDELKAALPEGFQCKVRYVHTPRKRCAPLFSSPPQHEPETTRLESHFLAMTTQHQAGVGKPETGGMLCFGIEALVYSTKHLITIFVSKADSTGYLPHQKPSPVKVITTTFLRWLSAKERYEHPARKLVISLFARSQTQYLFPGSAENASKHVLDDRQLIKWWARVLDPMLSNREEHLASVECLKSEYDGYITVPGYDRAEILRLLPPQNHYSGAGTHWHPGDPLAELAEARGIPKGSPPRCLLPRFPDDPKARFMQDLDDEAGISEEPQATISPSKRKSGRWSSIRDLDRFWEAMEFRQECSSGRLVGFLWLVIRPKSTLQNSLDGQSKAAETLPAQDHFANEPKSEPISEGSLTSINSSSPRKRRRKPLTGPIIARRPRLKGRSSSLTVSDLSGMLDADAGDGLLLSKEGYDKAMHTLLHLDFANVEVATQSTSKWIAEASQVSSVQSDWALEITGTAKGEDVAKNVGSNGNLQVNDLGGMIRKKRKTDDQVMPTGHAVTETPAEIVGEARPVVNMLGAGMIRKKPKPAVT